MADKTASQGLPRVSEANPLKEILSYSPGSSFVTNAHAEHPVAALSACFTSQTQALSSLGSASDALKVTSPPWIQHAAPCHQRQRSSILRTVETSQRRLGTATQIDRARWVRASPCPWRSTRPQQGVDRGASGGAQSAGWPIDFHATFASMVGADPPPLCVSHALGVPTRWHRAQFPIFVSSTSRRAAGRLGRPPWLVPVPR